MVELSNWSVRFNFTLSYRLGRDMFDRSLAAGFGSDLDIGFDNLLFGGELLVCIKYVRSEKFRVIFSPRLSEVGFARLHTISSVAKMPLDS